MERRIVFNHGLVFSSFSLLGEQTYFRCDCDDIEPTTPAWAIAGRKHTHEPPTLPDSITVSENAHTTVCSIYISVSDEKKYKKLRKTVINQVDYDVVALFYLVTSVPLYTISITV